MTVVLGAFHLFQGLVFLLAPDLVGGEGRGAVVHLDLALSGRIQLAAGCLVIVAGLGVFGGYLWARTVVVVLAVSSLVTNFALLGTAPLWSLIVVALDLVVILAVTIHGSDVKP